jgi:uncharacterized protein with GYD domain
LLLLDCRGDTDAQKRLNAARDLAKKVGVEIKQVWLTNGGGSTDAFSITVKSVAVR